MEGDNVENTSITFYIKKKITWNTDFVYTLDKQITSILFCLLKDVQFLCEIADKIIRDYLKDKRTDFNLCIEN